MKHAALLGACIAALPAALIAAPLAADAPPERTDRLASRKAPEERAPSPPLLGTLVELHGDVRVPLDGATPSAERFAELLADRVTGERRELSPELLALLRALAERHPGARVELVSGYRSPKLNEMLRKKGHHVASHSQHSLGNACDFRVVLPGDEHGMHPLALEREMRALGWAGGVGVYTGQGDGFVHADVGPERRWAG